MAESFTVWLKQRMMFAVKYSTASESPGIGMYAQSECERHLLLKRLPDNNQYN